MTDQTRISEPVIFRSSFQKKRKQKTAIEIENVFSDVDVTKLSENQAKICEEDLTKKDSLKTMQNDKPPGNNGLTK